MEGGGDATGLGAPEIEAALGALTGRAAHLAAGPDPLTGGLSAALATFRLLDPPPGWAGDLVLRAPRDGEGASREFVLQREVAAAGYPAPHVLGMDTGRDNPLGRPYLVMPRVPGTPMFADAGPIEVLRGFRRLPGELARLMLGLHALDAGPVEAALRSDGGRGTAQLGADALLADLAVGRGCELSAVRPWLDARRPAPGPTVVCHGDLHALNVLSAGDRVTVVDWELATVGDPALDVARTALILAAVPVEMSAAARRPVQRLGAGAARRFVRAYTEHRPLDPRAVAWYGVLHAARILARLEQRDSASDPVLDAWAPTAPLLRARIERIAGIPIS